MVLVLTAGSAMAVDWADENIPAILMAWYPGQRGGDAVADVLFGNTNPGGRLPVTFYRERQKLPPFDDYSMEERTYRYFTGTPLYPFGHGLSYTRFEYTDLQLDRAEAAADDTLRVSLKVGNVGARAGDEVVQLYLHPVDSSRPRALKELRGVRRVTLEPGETRSVSFEIVPSRDLRHYDVDRDGYAVDPGSYEVQVGASSSDVRVREKFTVTSD
jgi:beta-glucosidase